MFCANAAAYDYKLYTPEEMKKMNTRHLLSILRKTYTWGCIDACWTPNFKCCYREQLKKELAKAGSFLICVNKARWFAKISLERMCFFETYKK